MSNPERRDELYGNWLEWVTTNLGRDRTLAGVAANAAADAATHGRGFNAAAEAARTAWMEAASSEKTVKDAAARAGLRPPLQRTIDTAPSRKHAAPWVGFVDLAAGVYGAILVNLLACLVLGLSWLNDWGAPILIVEAVAALILNIGALVISAVVRPRIMYAMLVVDLIVWVIVLLAALVVVAGAATFALGGF